MWKLFREKQNESPEKLKVQVLLDKWQEKVELIEGEVESSVAKVEQLAPKVASADFISRVAGRSRKY